MNDVYERIAKKMALMSKSQKKIADYILNHKDEIIFMNVNQLAKATDVSEASIIRFATFMGCKGYPELQNELRKKTREQLSIRDRLEISYDEFNENDAGVAKIFTEDSERIQRTLAGLDFQTFHEVLQKLADAERIFIICGRSAVALGSFFQYYLNMVLGNTELVTVFEQKEELMYSLTEKDVVMALTFNRYTKRTVEGLAYAHRKGAVTVAITDLLTSPVIRYSDYYFLTETQLNTYLDSFVAPLSLINAILTYLGRSKSRELEEKLGKMEEMWNEWDVFW